MAFEIKPYGLEKEKEDERNPTPGTVTSMPGAPAAPAPAAGPQNGASKFVNFERYLGANQDVVNRQAGQIANKVDLSAGGVRTQLAGLVGGATAGAPTPGENPAPVTPRAPPAPTPSAPKAPTPNPYNPFSHPTEYAAFNAQHNAEAPTGGNGGFGIDPVPGGGRGTPSQPFAGGAGAPPVMPGSSLPPPEQTSPTPPAAPDGPRSLQDMEGWDDFASNYRKADEQLGALGTPGGLEALAGGGMPTGGSRLNAAMLGSVGGQRFRALQDKYKNLGKEIDEGDATVRKHAEDADVAYQKELDRIAVERQKALDAGNATEAARLAAEEAALKERNQFNLEEGEGKYENWSDYTGGNRFENTVRTMTTPLNPIGQLQEAGGSRDSAKGGIEKLDAYGRDFGLNLNASKYNWGLTGHLGTHSDETKTAVFNSLTGAELKALEKMPNRDQDKFIDERLWKLADFAKASVEKLKTLVPMQSGPMGLSAWAAEVQKRYGLTPEKIKQLQHLSTINRPKPGEAPTPPGMIKF
jgi:hypothetical protein